MLLDYWGFANARPDAPVLLSWVPNFPGCSKNPGQYSNRYLYPSPMRDTEFLRMLRKWTDETSTREQSLFLPGLIITSLDTTSDVLTKDKTSWGQFASSVTGMLKGEMPILDVVNHRHPLLKLASALCRRNIEARVWDSPEVLRVIRLLQSMLFESQKWRGDTIFGYERLNQMYLGFEWAFDLCWIYGCDGSEPFTPVNSS